MRDYGRKRGWRSYFESPIVLGIIFIIVLVFAWNVFSFWNKMRETSKNKALARDKVASLEEEKAKLGEDITRLDTDAGIEENIREKFGYGKEGEGLIIVVEDEGEVKVDDGSGGGFWNFIKNLFK